MSKFGQNGVGGSGGAGAGGAKDYFTEGRGRGFDIPDRKEYAATNKARTVPEEINLNDLNKPGKGPVNHDLQRGRIIPSLT